MDDSSIMDDNTTDPVDHASSNISTVISKSNRDTSSPTKKKLERSNYRLQALRRAIRIKRDTIRRLYKANQSAKRAQNIIEGSKKFLTPEQHELLSIQIRKSAGMKGKRYSENFKAFCVSMYFKSPACYRFLKEYFKLPSKSALQNWTSTVQFGDGLCPNMFKVLGLRVQRLPAEDRVACLMIDEISLKRFLSHSMAEDKVMGLVTKTDEETDKRHATGALVFLVSGLRSYWRQSISYYFIKNAMSGDSLKPIVMQVIKRLSEIGLHIMALSTDQGSNFLALLALLGVTEERPIFEDLDGNEVVVFSDPPHLLKSTRNCLSKTNIQTSTGTAKWQYLEQVYSKDKVQKTRMLHKLRDRHFNLKEFGNKMNVRRAAQVLSHSMAAALSTHASLGSIPADAQETAEFVERVNNLFDLSNSSKTTGK